MDALRRRPRCYGNLVILFGWRQVGVARDICGYVGSRGIFAEVGLEVWDVERTNDVFAGTDAIGREGAHVGVGQIEAESRLREG